MPIPDRAALNIPHYSMAGRGAYVLRPYRTDQPKGGTIFVQGTVTTHSVLAVLNELDARQLNVKLVAAISPELFRMQPREYKNEVCSWSEFMDSTFISNAARVAMQDWTGNRISLEYALTPDWDNRWRTGGTVEEVYTEARLSPTHLLHGIARFVHDRSARLARLRVDE